MPCVLRRLTELLRRVQSRGFDLVAQPDAGAAASEALNIRTPHAPVRPCDIGAGATPRPQPDARVWFEADDEEPAGSAGDLPASAKAAATADVPPHRPAAAATSARSQDVRPRSVSHVRCRGGELSLL